jgi:lysophospholipase L1-like esterase
LGRSFQAWTQRLGRLSAAHRTEFAPFARYLDVGTNDFQFSHPYNNAWSSAQGIAALVGEIHKAPIEPGMPIPPVLVVCPPPILEPRGSIAKKLFGAEKGCVGLADAYRAVAGDLGCQFFDAGSATPASRVDGIHLDSDQHRKLGLALVAPVLSVLALS